MDNSLESPIKDELKLDNSKQCVPKLPVVLGPVNPKRDNSRGTIHV